MENEGQLPLSPSRASYSVATSTGSFIGSWAGRAGSSNIRSEVLQSPLEETHAGNILGERTSREDNSYPDAQGLDELVVGDEDSAYDSDTPPSSQWMIADPGDRVIGSATDQSSASPKKWFSTDNLPTFSALHRNVLKCAIAYLIASLFTFYPPLSRFIGDLSSYGPGSKGPSPSAHMVATM
jgi:hypothetical protein